MKVLLSIAFKEAHSLGPAYVVGGGWSPNVSSHRSHRRAILDLREM